jgi:hypothetical protein
MVNPYSALLTVEGVLAVIFVGVLFLTWRKVDAPDGALWVLVWSTRVFASLKGIEHLPDGSWELCMYLALQSCSACALIAVIARSEMRVLKERLARHLFLQVHDADCKT